MALDPHGTLFPGHAGLGRTPETLGVAVEVPQPGYCPFSGGLLTLAPLLSGLRHPFLTVGLPEAWQPQSGGQSSSGHPGALSPQILRPFCSDCTPSSWDLQGNVTLASGAGLIRNPKALTPHPSAWDTKAIYPSCWGWGLGEWEFLAFAGPPGLWQSFFNGYRTQWDPHGCGILMG